MTLVAVVIQLRLRLYFLTQIISQNSQIANRNFAFAVSGLCTIKLSLRDSTYTKFAYYNCIGLTDFSFSLSWRVHHEV